MAGSVSGGDHTPIAMASPTDFDRYSKASVLRSGQGCPVFLNPAESSAHAGPAFILGARSAAAKPTPDARKSRRPNMAILLFYPDAYRRAPGPTSSFHRGDDGQDDP